MHSIALILASNRARQNWETHFVETWSFSWLDFSVCKLIVRLDQKVLVV